MLARRYKTGIKRLKIFEMAPDPTPPASAAATTNPVIEDDRFHFIFSVFILIVYAL